MIEAVEADLVAALRRDRGWFEIVSEENLDSIEELDSEFGWNKFIGCGISGYCIAGGRVLASLL